MVQCTCLTDKGSSGSSLMDYFTTTDAATAAVEDLSVHAMQAEFDQCPLTLALQAVPAANPVSKSDSGLAEAQVHKQKSKYNPVKVEEDRAELMHRLLTVFCVPEYQYCLATALQSCSAQSAPAKSALALFGCR